jgi:hypothetical protein
MNLLEIAKNNAIPHEWQYYLFPMTFVGFGVLGAMFPFHTWSPDGHASAPTAVSMLHAGVLMKLGGYGCFRIAIYLMPHAANEMAWIFLILTGISVVYGAFSACVQTDLKYINAYSSVSHCGMVLFAILMLNTTAMTGAIMQMLSHGLMTALFFALIGMIYGRTHTRDIRKMGGLMQIMPNTALSLNLLPEEIFIPEKNVAAAVDYFKQLEKIYQSIENQEERIKFVLASYNAGPGHVLDARALATKYHRDPNVWSDVREFLLRKSDPVFYSDEVCKYGYCRGKEPVTYVDVIMSKYADYKLWAR